MVSGTEAVKISLEVKFKDIWEEYTPISYQNVPFTPPSLKGGNAWVKLNIMFGELKLVAMKGLFRGVGLMDVQLFADEGAGSGKVLRMADKVIAAFSGLQFEGILCKGVQMSSSGVVGGWLQVNVAVSFQFEIEKL